MTSFGGFAFKRRLQWHAANLWRRHRYFATFIVGYSIVVSSGIPWLISPKLLSCVGEEWYREAWCRFLNFVYFGVAWPIGAWNHDCGVATIAIGFPTFLWSPIRLIKNDFQNLSLMSWVYYKKWFRAINLSCTVNWSTKFLYCQWHKKSVVLEDIVTNFKTYFWTLLLFFICRQG